MLSSTSSLVTVNLELVTFGVKSLSLCGIGLFWLWLDSEPRNLDLDLFVVLRRVQQPGSYCDG